MQAGQESQLLRGIGFQTTSDLFDTPKTVKIDSSNLSRLCATVRDVAHPRFSFAGSATTGSCGTCKPINSTEDDRRFILVEMEDYADRLTAERVRRVSNGYRLFKGNHEGPNSCDERITWSALKNAYKLTSEVDKIENLQSHDFDAIKKTVKERRADRNR